MKIDLKRLLAERRISMTKLARQEEVAISTPWRWEKKGVRGIYLETYMRGGRRYTTHEAFARFVEATTKVSSGEQPSSTSRTNRQRQAAIAHAERALDAAGI